MLYKPTKEDYEKFLDFSFHMRNNYGLNEEEELLKNFGNLSVEKRVKKINSKYRTRMWGLEIENVIVTIKTINFEVEIDNVLPLVNKLRLVKSDKKRTDNEFVDHLSFATKYCHHYRPNKFPIYDRINRDVLHNTSDVRFEEKYENNEKENQQIRSYKHYVGSYKEFCKLIGIEYDKLPPDGDEGFYIDKFIQTIGGRGKR